MIADFRPDVAHVRNIYHHLSPSILWELKAQKIPVVYHLNDFKLLCPSYNMVAQGNACERCRGGKFRHVMKQGCYAGPPGAAFLLAAEAYLHKWIDTYGKCVDCFLAPSHFVKQKLVENGWPADRIEVLPHFQRWAKLQPFNPDAPILYFGRLSPEKGVADLLHAMQKLPNLHLQIAGDGMQRVELEALAKKLSLQNVEFLGHLKGDDLERVISACRFSVLPSRAYETFGKSILESFARGRAVVASDLGSRRELIRHGATGLLFPVGDVERLAHAISVLANCPQRAEEMGAAGRDFARAHFSPDEHYAGLIQLYRRLSLVQAASAMQIFPRTHGPSRTPTSMVPGQSEASFSQEPRKIKVAFIGGRGVISKYSGIETYFEEAGPRLAELDYEVTVYCRSYFTADLETHKGMRLVRVPCPRSKHFETVIHTWLSTMHALFAGYDIVHYHALGPALFSFLPRLLGKKTVVTVQGLDWRRKKWGTIASLVLRSGERAAVAFPQCHHRRLKNLASIFSRATRRPDFVYSRTARCCGNAVSPSHILQRGLQPENYILFLRPFFAGKKLPPAD